MSRDGFKEFWVMGQDLADHAPRKYRAAGVAHRILRRPLLPVLAGSCGYFPLAKGTKPSRFGMRTLGRDAASIVSLSPMMPLS